jgi:hypothetical protein
MVELRCFLLLPLDDLVAVVKEFIELPASCPAIHRCLARHAFDQLCKALGIEYGPTRPLWPQTNGMVERFDGRIEEVLRSHHFRGGEDFKSILMRYVWL